MTAVDPSAAPVTKVVLEGVADASETAWSRTKDEELPVPSSTVVTMIVYPHCTGTILRLRPPPVPLSTRWDPSFGTTVGLLLLALTIYAVVLAVSFFVQRPGVRRLLGLKEAATEEEKERWRVRARRQRYISYGIAAAIGLIGWLMMSKPTF